MRSPGPRGPYYITRAGAERLQHELALLRAEQRPRIVQEVADAAAQGDRSENAEYIYGKKKLREIDRRILWLQKRLESATVVSPGERDAASRDRVFFGARVTVTDDNDEMRSFQIVGEDEIDLARGHISYRSPLGRALLSRRVGDTITVLKPNGSADYTIEGIAYD